MFLPRQGIHRREGLAPVPTKAWVVDRPIGYLERAKGPDDLGQIPRQVLASWVHRRFGVDDVGVITIDPSDHRPAFGVHNQEQDGDHLGDSHRRGGPQDRQPLRSFLDRCRTPGWRGSRTRRSSPSRNSAFVEPLDGTGRTGRSAYCGKARSTKARTTLLSIGISSFMKNSGRSRTESHPHGTGNHIRPTVRQTSGQGSTYGHFWIESRNEFPTAARSRKRSGMPGRR